MQTVRVSPKFQVVIPQEVRQGLRLHPGARMQVIEYENRIEMIPVKKMKEMRGFLKGISSVIERDKDRC
jgi:AbrB family looped-hinge helix DNA binding protein